MRWFLFSAVAFLLVVGCDKPDKIVSVDKDSAMTVEDEGVIADDIQPDGIIPDEKNDEIQPDETEGSVTEEDLDSNDLPDLSDVEDTEIGSDGDVPEPLDAEILGLDEVVEPDDAIETGDDAVEIADDIIESLDDTLVVTDVAIDTDDDTVDEDIVDADTTDIQPDIDQYIDTTPPTVVSTSPAESAITVGVGTTIEATFSEPMSAGTVNTETITVVDQTPATIAGTVGYAAGTYTAIFTPAAPLDYDTAYTVTVTTGVEDEAGNALAAAHEFLFTTATEEINECVTMTDPCDDHGDLTATCEDTEGSYTCNCDLGFDPTGGSCMDIDECTLGTDTCHENADCENDPGSYICTCKSNYSGNGYNCIADTRLYPCPAKPATGAVWNTVSGYMQTWDGAAWMPADDATTEYNTTASDSACRYVCDPGYSWNGSACVVQGCPNGVVEPALGENCDDGNAVTEQCTYGRITPNVRVCGSSCVSTWCVVTYCGDITADAAHGEECDDGNDDNTDLCKNDCTLNCGDGANSIVTSGLVLRLAMDTGTGTEALDSSGNNNDGVITGNAVWVAGEYLNALSFDGTDDLVAVPDSAGLRLTRMTVEAWVYIPSTVITRRIIFTRGALKSENYGLWVETDDVGSGPTGHLMFHFDCVGLSGGAGVHTPLAYNDDAWHHVAGTYDGADLKVYVDGALVATKNNSGRTPLTTANAFYIGGYMPGGASYDYFSGSLDEVRIYDRALSAAEILKNYSAVFEECDDGDNDDGDGCSAACTIESGWFCAGTPSICQN